MQQRALLVSELKRTLREHGITYAMVAKKLKLSEASVKRLFSTGDFSLERIDQISEMAKTELSQLVERMHARTVPTTQLSDEQESEVVADPKLFLMTWLILNRYQYTDIVKTYKFSEQEAQHYLSKLDRLKIIELHANNRVRLLVSRNFAWRAGGHVQTYIHQKLIKEFFSTQFLETEDEFFFHGGVVSDVALTHLKRALQNAARDCVEIMERDRTVTSARKTAAAFVLALHPWEYSGFTHYLRKHE